MACYRKALELDPKLAIAHAAQGRALQDQGAFQEAHATTAKALQLLPPSHRLRPLVTRQLQFCQLLLDLNGRLLALLAGNDEPVAPAERVTLAELCQVYKKRYATAARFFADAFAADPKLAADLDRHYRYNAACSAALAAAGQGEDAGLIPDKVALGLRRQALAWLRADLAAYRQLLTRGPDANLRNVVRQRLAHWQQDSDLAALRDKDALDKLPEDEQKSWRELWDEVARLLQQANADGANGRK
jgi:serine/threonine-protein kinase